jgi:hypothetical protein
MMLARRTASSPLLRGLVLALVAGIGVVSAAAVVVWLAEPLTGLLPQGPAAVASHLQEDLSAFFDSETIALAQPALHFCGIVVFVGLALVLAWRRGGDRLVALAAITLAALGAALFAPVLLLRPAGPELARLIGALTPTELPGFWGSVAGLATLAFLSVFPDGEWHPSWTRRLLLVAAVSGLVA